jgi:hypothetical protein
MAEKSLLKCMLDHLKVEGESLANFRAGIEKLTAKDKVDLKAMFEKEYGYTLPGNPAVDSGVAA